MNETELILRVFVVLFFGFVLLMAILPFAPEIYKPLLSQIIGVASFLLGCYLLKEVLRLKKGVKMEIFTERITNKAVNLWILIVITYFLFLLSLFFLLSSLNISPYILMIAIVLSSYGFAFAIIALGIYEIMKKREVKIGVGFNKQRLPLAVVDLVLAILIFSIANFSSFLKNLFIFVGVLFLILAILSLTLEIHR